MSVCLQSWTATAAASARNSHVTLEKLTHSCCLAGVAVPVVRQEVHHREAGHHVAVKRPWEPVVLSATPAWQHELCIHQLRFTNKNIYITEELIPKPLQVRIAGAGAHSGTITRERLSRRGQRHTREATWFRLAGPKREEASGAS